MNKYAHNTSRMNSKEYWNERFRADWQQKNGCQQTRYFYQLILRLLPKSIKAEIKEKLFSVVDVGCGEGDGTVLLSEIFDNCKISGVDFSEIAVANAKVKYPDYKFSVADIFELKEHRDVVVISNVLEHIDNPRGALERCFEIANKYVIIMVPFVDKMQEVEHVNRFTFSFFPLAIKGFNLCHCVVEETDRKYWDGWQLLAIYKKGFDEISLERVISAIPLPFLLMNGVNALDNEYLEAFSKKDFEVLAESQDNLERRKIAQIFYWKLLHQQEIGKTLFYINEKDKTIKELIKERVDKEKAELMLSSMREEVAKCQELCRSLEHDLSCKSEECSALTGRCNGLEHNLSVRSAELATSEEHCRELAHDLSYRAEECNAMAERCKGLEHDLRKKIAELDLSLKDHREMRAVFENSFCWRITAPIRVVGMAARNICCKGGLGYKLLKAMYLWLPIRVRGRLFALKLWYKKKVGAQDVILPVRMGAESDNICEHYARTHDFVGNVWIFASVPFDDIGGGQRSAQFTRCLLDQMFHVVYIYKYPKVEQGKTIANEHKSSQFSHLFFDNLKDDLFQNADCDGTVIFEFPHPDFVPYLKKAKKAGLKIVYERIDPWETSLGNGWYSKAIEDIFIKSASKVVATAKTLYNKLIEAGRKDALYVPNAADNRYFPIYARYEKPVDYPTKFQRNILYFGSMYGEWFDWGCLKTAALANPSIGFLLIGDPPEDRTNMPQNIIFLGIRKNYELAAYLHVSNAAMIPFRPSELVDAVSPIKIFEYIFSGIPVITESAVETIGYPGVFQAKDEKAFAHLCSLTEVNAASEHDRDAFIARNNWHTRLDQIIYRKALKNSYSIVILIHNNEGVIERILDTLIFHTKGLPIEIIVVDNASKDAGPQIVKEKFGNSVVLLHNSANGCSSGRNLGAKYAHNDIIVFFDSDQWFLSCAWLYEYDFISERHPEIGAFGWNAGWFADEQLHGPIVDYIRNRATDSSEYRLNGFRTDVHYLATSGFFIRKTLFDEIGGLDVRYDPTIFEDTDLSMKVLAAGFKIAYRNFAGIVHQPHQTTKADSGAESYNKLWLRNHKIFMKKWKDMVMLLNEGEVL